MTKTEYKKLQALANKLFKLSNKLSKKSSKVYKTAGYSDETGGTGDEGWRETFELAGESFGYLVAATELEKILNKMEVEF